MNHPPCNMCGLQTVHIWVDEIPYSGECLFAGGTPGICSYALIQAAEKVRINGIMNDLYEQGKLAKKPEPRMKGV